jgi:hypothetical protein
MSSIGAPPSLARCLKCAYVLDGLVGSGKCPECGCDYDLSDPRTFTRRPPFIRWKFWLPGFLLAAGVGLIVLAIGGLVGNAWGWALWLGTPLSAGSVLGYRARAGPVLLALLGLGLTLSLVMGALSMSLGGVFCGMVLSVIFAVPMLGGIGIGFTLRQALKASGFSQRSYLPILLIMLLALAACFIEGPPDENRPPESVSTEAVFRASAFAAWDSIVFYEEVDHPPPLLLRIGLVRPIRAYGDARTPGGVKVCIYNRGRLVKQTTRAEPGKVLAFVVLEQKIHYERDVRLRGGSFEFEERDGGDTLVRVTTVYSPRLGPRFAWRWGEAWAIHTLHRHVLEGMRRRAEGPVTAAMQEQTP